MSKLGSTFTFKFLAVSSSKLDIISMYFDEVFSKATSTCDKTIIMRNDATLVQDQNNFAAQCKSTFTMKVSSLAGRVAQPCIKIYSVGTTVASLDVKIGPS
jgi:hypothetical protein